jgi:23S rRNA pseudouridine1911/1915/1917 synthase
MPFVKEKFTVPKRMPAFLFIMRQFNFTQGQAQRVLAKGRLLINGESIFNTGDSIEGEVEVVYFKPSSRENRPLFQNKDFMIFEKFSGVLVHPNTMATPYSLLDEIRTIAGNNANAVHRIDMETSGLLLASKHKKAESYLKTSFDAVVRRMRRYNLNRIPIVIESHTKLYRDYGEVKRFIAYIIEKYGNEVEFSDFSSYLKEIENSPDLVRIKNDN